MKFAIRDDDLNYFFNSEQIERNYKDIWDICPVSMSVVPFIKGDWLNWIERFEKIGPGIMTESLINEFYSDNEVSAIGDNPELISFLKKEIDRGRIYLTIHAIHHRNEDDIIPQFKNNYGIGAEFYTNRNLTSKLQESILYLEDLLNQKIEVFTPPQNIMSDLGLDAVINNNLAIVGSYPPIRRMRTFNLLGVTEYLKYLSFRFWNRGKIYPLPLINNKLKIVNYYNLMPGSNLKELYRKLDDVYSFKGTFVLATHSYGFNYKMKNSNKTMGEVLKEIVSYAATKSNVQFVNMKEIFE